MKFIPFLCAFALCFSQIHENKTFGYCIDLPDQMALLECASSDECLIAVDETSGAIAIVFSDSDLSEEELQEYYDMETFCSSLAEFNKAFAQSSESDVKELADLNRALKLVEALGFKLTDLTLLHGSGKGTEEKPMCLKLSYKVDGEKYLFETVGRTCGTTVNQFIYIALESDEQREENSKRAKESFLQSMSTKKLKV